MKAMADAIAHRGPDSEGYWQDADPQIALAHRRLAVVDLSTAGHQPMHSANGRYVIAFNGEIYNHQDLRAELAAAGGALTWRGHSDTETLLAGFACWGIEPTLRRAIGMFAFAVWDRRDCMLTLGRDRLGEKPLYYGWQGAGAAACFLFGSELKALRSHSSFAAEIDRGALCLYLRHNHVPAPYSIYRGISKLPPGCLLSVSLREREPKLRSYWSASDVALSGLTDPFRGPPEQAVDELETLLKDAVRRQMMADVPLGAFLSGGIDSSTVAALMQTQSARPVKTFTIGFHEEDFDEAAHAKAVAAHLGTDHTDLYLTAQQAMDVIPRLPVLYDEPFSDSSQIPTHLVSQLARQSVTVSLSGDGGDELFCGYNRYAITQKLWKKLSAVPSPLRRMAAFGLTRVSTSSWNRMASAAQRAWPAAERWAHPGEKVHKGARSLMSRDSSDLYLGMVSDWTDPESVVINGTEPPTLLTGASLNLTGLTDVERMMALDLLTYLPNDILTKVDRAAMGVSLETRVPLLDHRVVEFAWRLPLDMKLRRQDGVLQTKWALRQVLHRHVPQALIDRPKVGFGVPVGEWLRGPLRNWAEGLLDETRLRREGYFDPTPIRQQWREHIAEVGNHHHRLWTILMFQAWLEASGTVGQSGKSSVD